ncbi:MAG: DUF4163 domain-containing protein [Bacteroidales bacterium]|nr:DUF4163 domain-containing protein [Bacteroidales bacterium]
MKTSILFVLFGLFLFVGCNKKEVKFYQSDISQKDSTEHLIVDISLTGLNTDEKFNSDIIDVYNDSIHKFIAGIRSELRKDMEQYKSFVNEDSLMNKNFTFELYVKDTVFLASTDLISTRILVYMYQGGANGSNNYYAFNYLPKEKRFIDIKSLLQSEEKKINLLLPKHFINTDSCFNDVPTYENTTCINESLENYIFTFNQYILGPRYCGEAVITIPKNNFSDK